MATFITWFMSVVSTHMQCKQENHEHTTHTEDFCLRHDKAFFEGKYCCHLLIVVALYCKCSLKVNKRKHRPYDWQGLRSHSFSSHSCCLLLLALAPGVWHWGFFFFFGSSDSTTSLCLVYCARRPFSASQLAQQVGRFAMWNPVKQWNNRMTC